MADDTSGLVRRADLGDQVARDALLQRHRARLERMVRVRMDPRLGRRLDPADIVQDALVEADRKLDDYVRTRPLPFYPWLRHIAWERLVKAHEFHLHAQKRSLRREQRFASEVTGHSAADIAQKLAATGPGPLSRAALAELQERVFEALEELQPIDRELLILRYVEHSSVQEVAAITSLSPSNVKVRCLRALDRLRQLLGA